MKFSYSAVWDDTAAMIRAHGSLIAALAGVFIFLPSLLLAYLLPQPVVSDPQQLVPAMTEYLQANWHWLLIENLLNMVGVLAILRLALPDGNSTVGGTIAAAFAILPFYFLANMLSSIILVIGLVLLIVPGLYLSGRLTPLGAVIVAENRRNPIDALRRTFEITKGHGWAVFGLVVVIAIAGMIVMLVVNGLLGVIFRLVAGAEIGGFLTLIIGSATGAAFVAVLTTLYAAIYRNLAAPASARVFE
ncbi:hypothetical protein [Sphingosinicella sp. BN140058]|uniref:hypothetical protein n=1 Tax=Sphingosinicella sp. BN140058 TaxID=1892855 RepID=UPI001012AD68|nr:hypothetical protein [Sphingosinicella sp. BN140058]QAY79599.1 hypothetical protein ETR14_25935 [Sphingosinicella sp. BN140058]